MQDQSLYSQMNNPTFPEQEHLNCPRCDSPNTKFCYYNNYNLSQPRHYCKNCKRYWTKGGSLRNIPVGGASRKATKRSSITKKPLPPPPLTATTATAAVPSVSSSVTAIGTGSLSSPKGGFNQDNRICSALLGNLNEGQSSHLANESSPDRPNLKLGDMQGSGSCSGSGSGEGEVRIEKNSSDISSCWKSGSDWPDLAIFTPGSNIK